MEDKVRLGEDTMEEVSAVTEEGIMGLLLLTELAELANESLASDLEGQDFSLANFGNLLHCEMEPIRTRLDSTGRTVSGIAETLYHIQVTTTANIFIRNENFILWILKL